MLKQILAKRSYQVEGGWYAPQNKLESFASVTHVSLMNIMSSAGDWDGLFVQKIGKTYYVITFSQENNYPRGGFTLNTGEVLAESDCEFSEENLNKIYSELLEMYA